MRSREDLQEEIVLLREYRFELEQENRRLKRELATLRKTRNEPTDEELAAAGLEFVAAFENEFGPIPERTKAEVARKMGGYPTTELIEELIRRQIDWRFYKQVYENRLANLLKEYKRSEAERQQKYRDAQDAQQIDA